MPKTKADAPLPLKENTRDMSGEEIFPRRAETPLSFINELSTKNGNKDGITTREQSVSALRAASALAWGNTTKPNARKRTVAQEINVCFTVEINSFLDRSNLCANAGEKCRKTV